MAHIEFSMKADVHEAKSAVKQDRFGTNGALLEARKWFLRA